MKELFPFPRFRALDASGDPLNGGKIYFYEAGTSTPKDTYTTQAGDTANANPVVLDSEGYADIWGDGAYKVVIKDSSDVTISTTDNVVLNTAPAFYMQYKGNVRNLTDDFALSFESAKTLSSWKYKTSTGTVDITAKINTTIITGASAVEADDTITSGSLTANNTGAAGDEIKITLANASDCQDLEMWFYE